MQSQGFSEADFKRVQEKQSKSGTHHPINTRRSIIPKDQEHIAIITQPSIDDILALELSEELLNVGYHLEAFRITNTLQKLCNPIETLFCFQKMRTFSKINAYSHRFERVFHHPLRDAKKKNKAEQREHAFKMSQTKGQKNSLAFCPFTNQQIVVTAFIKAAHNFQKISKLMKRKQLEFKAYTLFKLKSTKLGHEQKRQQNKFQKKVKKTEIQETFERYQQSRARGRFNRLSIDKKHSSFSKSLTKSSFSLNKEIVSPRNTNKLKSPQKDSQNILYPQMKGGSNRKASTCENTLSENSSNEEKPKSGVFLSRASQRSIVSNDSNFPEGSKQRELQLLRKKYYRLVDEFRQFSERFLQVIQEE